MVETKSENKPFNIDLGAPLVEGKDGYYGSFIASRFLLGRLISERWTPNVKAMTLFMISGIVDTDKQNELFDKINTYYESACTKRVEEKRKTNPKDSSLSQDEREMILFEVCMRIQGEISTWYDTMVGIVSKNVYNMV